MAQPLLNYCPAIISQDLAIVPNGPAIVKPLFRNVQPWSSNGSQWCCLSWYNCQMNTLYQNNSQCQLTCVPILGNTWTLVKIWITQLTSQADCSEMPQTYASKTITYLVNLKWKLYFIYPEKVVTWSLITTKTLLYYGSADCNGFCVFTSTGTFIELSLNVRILYMCRRA